MQMKNIHVRFEVGKAITDMAKGMPIEVDIDSHCLSVASEYKEILHGLAAFVYEMRILSFIGMRIYLRIPALGCLMRSGG